MNARLRCVALPLVLGLVFASTAIAQDQATDDAKALLKQGLAQYKAFDFKSAQATLLKAKDKEKSLEDADQKTLNDVLDKVGGAIKQQAADRETYDAAEASVKAGKLAEAKVGFEKAAASEFLGDAERKDAKAQLAAVVAKLKAAGDTTPALANETKPVAEGGPVAETSPSGETPSTQTAKTPTASAIEALEAGRAAKVQDLIAQGTAAMNKGQADEAAKLFQRAVDLDKNNKEAQVLLAKAQSQVATPSPIDQLARDRDVARQMADLEFEKNIKQATELEAKAKSEDANADKVYGQAADAAAAAKKIAEDKKDLFGATESQNKVSQAETVLKLIAVNREAWNIQHTRRTMEEAERANRERIIRQEQQKREKVATLNARVKTLEKEGKPKEALEVLDQILVLDPSNQIAAAHRDGLLVNTNLRREGELVKLLNREMSELAIENREAEIPWHVLTRFPDNWRDLTVRREQYSAVAQSESEANRDVRQKLRTKIGKIDFKNQPLADVVQFFREVSGTNFHVNWTALTAGGIDRSTQVNLNLSDVTVETALQLVLNDLGSQTKLGYVVKEGVVTISTKDDLAKTPVARVYDIRDLLVRVPTFSSPGVDFGNCGGTNNTSCSSNGCNTSNENECWVSKTDMVNALMNTVTSTIDRDSWQPTGTVGSIRELQGLMIISQTLENHQHVADLIAQLRETKTMQVNIEARFISVSTGFLESIGINTDLYFNIGSGLGGGSPTGETVPPSTQNGIVIDPFTGASVPITNGTSAWGAGKPGNNHVTPIAVTQQGGYPNIGFGNMLGVSTPSPSSIGTQVTTPALDIRGIFLDDIQVDFLVQATQANSLTRTLTAPRLTLYNGQKSFVRVGTQQAYVSSFTPVVSIRPSPPENTSSSVGTGSLLTVEATVSADRRYVTMTVEPEVTTLNSLISLNVGGGTVQLPNVTAQMLKTTVTVPDGGTLLLGVQRITAEVEREGGVPILSKIPVIDRLFNNRGKIRDEQTLLILIKPKIIIPREEEERAFPPK